MQKHGKQKLLTIDGATGEGGGKILRSSLALSLCLGKPFHMTKVRATRKKPGLQPPRLTARTILPVCSGGAPGCRASNSRCVISRCRSSS
ncbi:MAG: RNA 3'-terminal phosphate cyclase [Gammaproteobacteria bacterium]